MAHFVNHAVTYSFSLNQKLSFQPICSFIGSSRRRILLDRVLPCLLWFVCFAGCGDSGPATYLVQGKVTYDGNAVPTGSVIFLSQAEERHPAAIGSDGSYEVRLPAGEHYVGVFAPRESNKTGMEAFDEPPMKPYVPSRFNQPKYSGIKVTIEENNENTFDITLTPQRRRRR